MKTIIILGALVISTGAFAQGRIEKVEKEVAVPKSQMKEQVEKVKKQAPLEERMNQGKGQAEKIKGQAEDKMKGVKDEIKEKSNNGNAFGKDKEGMSGKEFGQNRAAEAKLKAAEVKTKVEADEMISTSKAETKETMGAVDTKLASARAKLTEKLAMGELTKAQVEEKMAKLAEFETRKNEIMSEMK